MTDIKSKIEAERFIEAYDFIHGGLDELTYSGMERGFIVGYQTAFNDVVKQLKNNKIEDGNLYVIIDALNNFTGINNENSKNE